MKQILKSGYVQDLWDVTYSSEAICAPKGSTVEMSCTFTYPEGINEEVNTLQETFWSTDDHDYKVDVKEDSKYSGRVQNTCVGNNSGYVQDLWDVTYSHEEICAPKGSTVEMSCTFTYPEGINEEVNTLQETFWSTDDHDYKVDVKEDSKCLPETSFIWFKNGEEIKDETSYRYSPEQVLQTDSYSCAVRGHEKFPSPPVYAPKPPSVSVSFHDEIVEGTSVNLTCSSDANPAADYTWYKADEPLNPNHTYPGATLVFSSIESSDFGEFYCEAENTLGRTTSKRISVNLTWNSLKIITRATLLLLLLSPLIPLTLWLR
ncbi:B-cell receptor CD22-like [Labrus mixtus]|uniref:B-cell receptor CD22-like n=1 Tax=Labrus mixtus TaxID=508554 RepID=UPI0029C076A5|nr:B-cell receptor CD22-like [Labrus mixtus]